MNFNSQDYLAKLLAKENLTVQHGNYSTASFDVINRVLRLPLWKDKGKDVYDLLVGHEIGHALYTPAQGWHDSPEEFDDIPRSYLNIIEDIRIEKLVQRTYPGIVRAFRSGYKTLFDDNLFGTQDRDMTKAAFMDRLNIHSKGRGYFPVEFSESEQLFVDLAMGVETWEDVLNACREIKDFIDNREDYEDEREEEISEGQGDENELEEEGEESNQASMPGDDMGDDGNDTEGSEGEPVLEDSDTLTDDVYRENTRDLLDLSEDGTQPKYSSGISKEAIKAMLIPYKILKADRDKYPTRYNNEAILKDYKEEKDSINTIANLMAKEFERKKAAFQYSRSLESKKGSLNVNKLHQYQYSEDIFQTVTTLANAKSHGIVMFMDLSGSMSRILSDVVKQTITIAIFCKKVNIPFEIYTFTSGANLSEETNYVPIGNTLDGMERLKIVEVINSKIKKREFNKACEDLYSIAHNGSHWDYGVTYGERSEYDRLGSTPLVQTAMAAKDIVKKFQMRNQIEKTNIIFLTDGMADTVQPQWDSLADIETPWGNGIVMDFAGKKLKTDSIYNLYSMVIKRLGEVTNANVIGFFLAEDKYDFQTAMPDKLKWDFKKEFAAFKKTGILDLKKSNGYDDYFIIKVGNSRKADQEFEVKDKGAGIAIRDVKREFRKFNKNKKQSRQIVNKITDAVAA
jgi:hypothetical protein